MSDFLSREQILAVVDTIYEEVPVPEWRGKVLVKSLTGTERDRIEATIVQANGRKTAMNLQNVRAKFVAWAVIDPDTHLRVFSENDILALGQKNAAALQRVFNVVQRLSGLSEEDLEEMTKNSSNGQSDGSGSDSPAISAAA